jgi:hypothetical protein
MSKLTPEELEQKRIDNLFSARSEFRVWVRVVTDSYLDLCDSLTIEPSIKGFI